MWPCYPIFFTLAVLLLSIVYRSGCDCSGNDVWVKDDSNVPMLSAGKEFELGFFSPDGNLSNGRFLGIWYYQLNPKIVVWVANRDKPLSDFNGCLAIRDGNAVILDMEDNIFWSTKSMIQVRRNLRSLQSTLEKAIDIHPNSSTNSTYAGTLQLNDNGNLILNSPIGFWQSFDHPTDTFLPGMTSNSSLTSWQAHNNPATGKFTVQPTSEQQPISLTISKDSSTYWKGGGPEAIPEDVSELLLQGTTNSSTTARLVMNSTGQVQFWKWESKGGWYLNWSEPKDTCSLYNYCGDFSSCNINNGHLCKCLPGFEPSVQQNWTLGDFSDGCSRVGKAPDDVFLKLPMMNAGPSSYYNKSTAHQDCENNCKREHDCVAFSCGHADCNGKGAPTTETGCRMWTSGALNLEEEQPEGFTIFVRTPSSIALTSRDCDPCGTNVVPYPLSTAPNCGDASYKYFRCNESNGQLEFLTAEGSFKVIATSPETKTFTIQIRDASNCGKTRANIESLILSPKPSLPFKVANCSLVNHSFAEVQHSFTEVEISWHPPPEPICNALLNCSDWAHTTCKARRGGEMRCICGSKFKWDGSILACREKAKFPIKVVVSCMSGALAVVLCGIFFIHYVQKKREAERQDAVEFQGDDSGAIDVPFFDWGSILAATTNFVDENKLGTGGFGAVYKGKLPDGREIAVKRLSSVSEQGIEEFRTEVVLIAKLQHRNLVRLLGYCMKAHERILVYEYMPNGSLDSCLFDQTRFVFLDWGKRFDIIFGIARGLLYLHEDSRFRVIHRDLKPSNILLDEELNPKISDFGIARIVGGKDTEGSTKRVVGTYGYMSPEYAYEGIFSVKSDVFSFGIVVLETISGRRNSKVFQIEHGLNLQGYAWKLWNEDRGLDLVDQTLKESCKQSQALKCIHIGLLCVQEDPGDRPTMSAVVWMFGAENASLPNPKQPAFISKKELSVTASSSSLMDSSSNNVITIPMEGR